MKRQWVRLITLLLSAVMLVACVPPVALARERGDELPALPCDSPLTELPALPADAAAREEPAQLAEAVAAPSGQPTGDYATPHDKLSGTSSDGPMSDAEVSSYFRIPALVTLDNGWIVAASDARWPNTNDSPNNLDTIVSVSKDGGATWEWEIINYFSDFAPIQGATYYPGTSKENSASFIDPAMVVDGSGKLWMAVDLQPCHVNLGQNAQKVGSGFDTDGLLMVGPISEAEWDTKVNTTTGRTEDTRAAYEAYYEYRVDINGTPGGAVQKDGKEVSLYSVFHKDDAAKTPVGYYVDAFFDLWYDYGGTEGIQPVLCLQKDRADTWVQANLFYKASPWKAYSTTYLMLRSATVSRSTSKLDWSEPRLISGVKNPGETFLAFCPGRGVTVTLENGTERLVFPVYDNLTGEKASVVYSDDGGVTWTRGARTEQLANTGKSSESQIVHLPNGDLRMYSRNDQSKISYADSSDNSATWGPSVLDADLAYGSNCMVSFINVTGRLVSPDHETIHENLILASYPWGRNEAFNSHNRSNGVIRIGSIDPETNEVTWLNGDTVRFPQRYNYSCLTQLTDCDSNADFAVLYEQDDTSQTKGVMAMHFVKLTAADLMGEGWTLETPVTLTVDTSLIDLDHDGSKTIAPTYSPADATVTWASYNESVVTAQGGVITAVGEGNTLVTVSVSKDGFTRSATIPVMVQPEDDVTLPEEYRSQLTTTVTPGVNGYQVSSAGAPENGLYMIYNPTNNRIMHHFDDGRTDQCTPTIISEGIYTSTCAKDVWTLTRQDDGTYTLQPNDRDGVYLNISGTSLVINATQGSFTITHTGNGGYTLAQGGSYLSTCKAAADTPGTFQLLQKYTVPDVTTYTVTADGLRALIRSLNQYEGNYTQVLAKADQVYDSEEAARAAQVAIDETAKPLYAQLRTGDTTQYTVTYMVNGVLWGVQRYFTGQTIVPMTRPTAPAGQVFAGWTGLPTDKRMPDHDLTLTASFKSAGGSSSGSGSSGSSRPTTTPSEDPKDPVIPPTNQTFTDVAENAWYSAAVAAVVDKGIMEAVADKTFAPARAMTRGMTARALYCLAAKPEVAATSSFLDLAEDVNYADAVAWGSATGVINGYDQTRFGGEDTLSREQLATLLYRYAKLIDKRDMTAAGDALTPFPDGGRVSGWATEAMAWAVSKRLILGRADGALAPQANITRAEAAVILERYLDLLSDSGKS